MNSRPLIIFTHYYPFGDLEHFLETEIRYLKEIFSHIVIVPNIISGPQRAVPEGVVVETSFAETFCGKDFSSLMRKTCRALLYAPFYGEFWHVPKKTAHIRKLMGYSSEAARCLSWLKGYLKKHPHLQQAIFYTYWFYDHTTGIALLKQDYPAIDIVSRAHGFDLYEEDYPPAYIPFRRFSLNSIDKLILISDHGHQYLSKRFPSMAAKTVVSKLGIEDPGFVIHKANKDAFTLVSCSHIVPLKRLHLQIDGIASFAKKYPDVPVEWQHVGDGPLKETIHAYARKTLPPSVKWSFAGHMPNTEVFDLYKRLQPDLFLLMSETEGLPVSIMEAHACGIPAMATAVGGVPEIVNADNGILLSASPTPDEIAKGLARVWTSADCLVGMKAAARLSWHTHFNAQHNYRLFASLLSS